MNRARPEADPWPDHAVDRHGAAESRERVAVARSDDHPVITASGVGRLLVLEHPIRRILPLPGLRIALGRADVEWSHHTLHVPHLYREPLEVAADLVRD